MGDSAEDKIKGGVPSWQLKPSTVSPEQKTEDPDPAKQQTLARASVVEKARQFLLEDEVRNAPIDKQVAFLESKGLESHEIKELIGITRNAEATSSNPESPATSEELAKETSIQNPSEPPSAPLMQSSRDAPPIITYPEFLITPTQPAPLITARRLLSTLYLFGSLSALLYGTSHYLIKPMIASLTIARHELAETTHTNLDKLITKLQAMVSELPPSLSSSASGPYRNPPLDQQQDESEDSDSDPTELFHRDIGVQTTPSISLPTSPSPSSPPSTIISSPLDAQTNRLSRITTHITDLNDASISLGQETSQLTTCMDILKEYLESLAYMPPTYTYGGGAGGMYGNVGAGQRNADGTADDEIAKVKAQIRGVKGVLLSARSFPAGTWQGRAR